MPSDHSISEKAHPGRITLRPFTAADAEDCFRIRTEAFVREFYPQQDPTVIAAGINAYMPSDYVRMGETMIAYVAVDDGGVIGFFVVKLLDATTAELMLLYVKGGYKGKGIGSLLLEYMENLLRDKYPEVNRVELDTIVPGYNGKFYEKMGFHRAGESELQYPDRIVKAVRMAKNL
ncbi:GNAT family N-acetyltransferase [Methanocella sp. MCL-LM]|uniref:GNAT family N-acetyltransferase n=1 Tax=Methanocella sp. MCL-LM TaxID=3412035 RepID=UPI003C71149C